MDCDLTKLVVTHCAQEAFQRDLKHLFRDSLLASIFFELYGLHSY